jgi:hypothetical protein
VDALLGNPIVETLRRSFMLPTKASASAADHQPTVERILYECQYTAVDWLTAQDYVFTISVELFDNPTDARDQMETFHEFYDDRLLNREPNREAFAAVNKALEPLVEIPDLGDQAYSFVVTPNNLFIGEYPSNNYPMAYFLSGNYLVAINIFPFPTEAADISAYYDKVYQFARYTLENLPKDAASPPAESGSLFNPAWLPANQPYDPCALISPQEIQVYIENPISYEESYSYLIAGSEAQLHTEIPVGSETSSFSGFGWNLAQCNYRGHGTSEEIAYNVQSGLDDRDLEIVMDQLQGFPELTDLGDFAIRGGNYFDISVISGNSYISVQVENGSDKLSQVQIAVELAKLLIDRIP